MSNKTLYELVREQIDNEAPQGGTPYQRELYVDAVLLQMNHVELLERISDAQRRLSHGHQELDLKLEN